MKYVWLGHQQFMQGKVEDQVGRLANQSHWRRSEMEVSLKNTRTGQSHQKGRLGRGEN